MIRFTRGASWLVLLLSASVVQAVDVQISKLLDTPDPAIRAGEITYTLSVLNADNDTANNVVVTLPVPATTTFSAVNNGACSHDGGVPGTVICNLGNITGDGFGNPVIDIEITLRSTAATSSTISVTGTVAPTDSNPGNNTLNQTTTINDGADLQISMIDATDPVISGANIDYTLTIQNLGPNHASTTTVVNTLPANVTYIVASGTGWSCSNVGQEVSCSRASVLNGATAPDINISGTVGAVTGTISNSATVSSLTGEPEPNNNTTTENTNITLAADLSITKSVSSPLIGGGTVTFTLTPRNLGFFNAATVVVSDPLPAGFSYLSASGPNWNCLHSGESTGGTVTCSRASYSVGASDDISIQATLPVSGSFVNTATINAATADPNGGNNSGSVNMNITPNGADLAITKSKTPALVAQGSTMSSIFQVTNNGPLASSGVLTVIDTLAGGEAYLNFSGTDWSCLHNGVNPGGVVTCTYANTLPNSNVTSNLNILTTATSLNVLSNNATVADVSGTVDANSGNNSASAAATSTLPVDLGITKTANTTNANSTLEDNENTISYTLTVTNNSATAADNITVTDLVAGYISGPPTTAVAVTTTPSGFTCSVGSMVICNSGGSSLAGGASAVFVIEVSRPITNSGALTNTASVTSSTFADPVSANNSATATVLVSTQAADLSISKSTTTSNSNTILEIGENTGTYTLTVVNNGPGPVTGIIIEDVIPGYIAGSTAISIIEKPTEFTCSTGATVRCNNGNNALAQGDNAVFTIEVTRPLLDGVLINTATVTSADIADPDNSNNSATANLTVDPIFDVEMQSNIVTPTSVEAGVNATYVLTVRNNGPSNATNVVVNDVLTSPGGRSVSKISVNPTQGTCDNNNWSGETLTCSIGTLTPGQSETITVVIRPDWDSSNTQWILSNTATASYTTSSTTTDSNTSNESQSSSLTVDPAEVDLLVNKDDVVDPIAFDPLVPTNNEMLVYQVDISNSGPSIATGVSLSDAMTPKSGKQLTFLCDDAGNSSCNAASSACNNTGVAVTGPATLTMNCALPDMAANTSTTRYLFFSIDSAPDGSGDTHVNLATVSANEIDNVTGNNSEGENTSVRAKVDLAVSTTADSNPVQLRQPFNWTLVVSNNGPGTAEQSTLSDTLPAGMELTTTPIPTQGSCTGSAGDTSFSCALGTINNAANVTVPVRVMSYPSGGTLSNSASVSTFSIDSDNSNNTDSDSVTVQRSSLAGVVYIDTNDNGTQESGENGINAIQIQLIGTDAYGNAVNRTSNSAVNGSYIFTDLSPSDVSGYTLSQTTQASGYFDGQENKAGIVVLGSKTTDNITAITVSSNSNLTGYLFSELATSSIAGFVWHDANNNGVKDGSESSGVTGIIITLTGNDDLGATVNTSVTTAANGTYTFNGLRPGTYTLNEGSVAGYFPGLAQVGSGANGAGSADNVATSSNFGNEINTITLQSGDSASGYNFGELLPASLAGRVFNDNNVDGDQDADEPSIAGVTLTLTGNDDLGQPVNMTTTTDLNGDYNFTGLRPAGAYTLTETQPTNYSGVNSVAGTLGGTSGSNVINAITVVSGDSGSAYNFSEQSPGISGYVYVDYNNNGNFDGGEAPLSGVSISLTGTQNNITTTNANGYFLFTGLPNGIYTISEAQPAGWAEGTISAGSVGGTVGNNQISGITLNAASIVTDYNFAERGNASLSGFVWHDTNNNGIRESGESNGIAGIVMSLTGTDMFSAAVNETATTVANGVYNFSNLRPGTYTLNEGSVTTYLPGLAQVGTGASSSAGTADNLATSPTFGNRISGIGVQNGDTASDYSFGELLTTSLAGTVFNDNNGDGNQDSGEPGMANVTVVLSGTDDLNQPVNESTVTTADGNYRFINLRPSNGSGYSLSQIQPAGYTDSVDAVGSLGGTLGNDVISAISVASDDMGVGYNFSERSTGLSGYVFADYNNDGSFDSSEPGLPGVVIILSGSNQSATATTDGNGYYIITGLPAGIYSISENQPAAWTAGIVSAGSAGGTVVSNGISAITLPGTTIGTDYNFAELGDAVLSGQVFNDNNNDGNQNTGEPGIAGVIVTLSGTDTLGQAVNRTATTAADGTYNFTTVRPADAIGYTLTETQPPAYDDAQDTLGTLGGNNSINDIFSAIVVSGNNSGSGYNFAELSSGISGYVYVDINNDGIFSGSEPPIPGVEISLSGSSQNKTATTDVNGYYIITGLPAGTYSLTESQPAGWAEGITRAGSAGGVVGGNQISNIILGTTTIATAYNFAEQGGSLSGAVYNDLSEDGVFDSFEVGVAGVNIALSGIDRDGNAINRTLLTTAEGRYRFSDLPQPNGNGYTITETQPAGMDDGIDALGSLGGTRSNDVFSNILFPGTGAAGTDYNFAEKESGIAEVSGNIWLDINHDRLNNDGGTGAAGWRVELILRSDPLDNASYTEIATTTTDSDGNYQFSDLIPGTGYEIRFRHPSTDLVYGTPLSGESDVDLSFGTIRNLTLVDGDNIIDQSLPLDPAGIIYDSLTRMPLEGAIVTITGPTGFDPATDLVGGVANVSQTTAADGFYQFLFLITAPAGTYTLSVVEPSGYLPGGSVLIPECTNTLTATALPNPALVHRLATAPTQDSLIHNPDTCPETTSGLAASADSTQHYLFFNLTPGVSGDVVNNHIPLDLITEGAFSVIKLTSKVNVSIGDLVPYTLRVTNNLTATLNSIIDVEDQLPPGFKYISGSARLDDVALEPQINGRALVWPNLTFTANQTREFKLVLVVGAGVSEGEYINQAWSENNLVAQTISNIATASVRVVPDPTFDCTDIIGKVYDDANLNGYPDAGEAPLPGVRLATARGWLVTTDASGRYHISCATVPNALRGSNFILKVDERSLPSGYRITTENPRVVRLTRGKSAKANFGASIHRVVRLDIANDAFLKDQIELAAEFSEHVEALLPLLKQKISVLRINYLADFETKKQAKQRLKRVKSRIAERWKSLDCCYNLIIEEELHWRTGKPRNPVLQNSMEARP